ncbi:MAG TPA: sigma-54 dependent transcriptional regulator [Blastocatellia bacterium]|nr:sigma-54 dependent transcriptional regulator [Blastocatellia bacterium]
MSLTPHILVADDERSIRLALDAGLSLNGFRVTCARSGREAVDAACAQVFDAILCDVFMPDGDGLDVIRQLRQLNPTPPIILMTAQGSVDLAVQAVTEGASDFIAKPFVVSDVAEMLRRYIENHREAEVGAGGEIPFEDFSRTGLVGRSAPMVKVYKLIAHAARSEATVLVTGESGTGKELVARAVHCFSDRAEKPFLAVNCAGLTDTLLESELFGHIKGAFTGAGADRAGLFEAADGGTLFLDELASTSAAFQASLLRVLQSGEVRRVGATQTRRVNVRVIGASNAALPELVAGGSFRADLYYRLSVLTIDLPPLRQRADDIELLALHFLRRLSEKLSGDAQPPFRLTREATEVLSRHSFPGNVRELENALTRATALAANRLITLDCLPPHFADYAKLNAGPAADSITDIAADWPTMEELERRYLQRVLEKCSGNRRRAAELLALNRRTIQRLLVRYRLFGAEEFDDVAED